MPFQTPFPRLLLPYVLWYGGNIRITDKLLSHGLLLPSIPYFQEFPSPAGRFPPHGREFPRGRQSRHLCLIPSIFDRTSSTVGLAPLGSAQLCTFSIISSHKIPHGPSSAPKVAQLFYSTSSCMSLIACSGKHPVIG